MSRPHRWLAFAVSLASVAAVVAVADPGVPVRADSAPVDPASPATPTTVTADALPTTQIDGVAWSQVVVGGRVYVGGNFANARPAGAAPGTNLTRRSNFLVYDLATGALVPDVAPAFNAQVRAVAASPDGRILYVGGDFTSVDGVRRDRLAAFELPSGRLVSTFAPPVGYHVHALAVSPDGRTLYVGGNFNSVGSTVRNRLAAFDTANGALRNWAPVAGGGLVQALVVSPDGTRIAVGGRFTSMNGSDRPGYGMALLDAATGASFPLPLNDLIRLGTDRAGVTSLVTDGTTVYGAVFNFISTSLYEGLFAFRWNGSTVWIADCHGDQYSVFPSGGALYAVGHAHHCGNIGGFPEVSPRVEHRALAFSTAATGVVGPNTNPGYADYRGNPAPAPQIWFPRVDLGTFTGQFQGPWHVTGNAQYVVLGGEFRNVNDAPQQGLVRFAVSSIAPNRQGPRLFGDGWRPTASSPASGVVELRFGSNWDRDNQRLTYRIERDGREVGRITGDSTFYRLPALSYTDRTAPPGVDATYRVVAVDAFGNQSPSASVTVRVAGTAQPPPPPASTFPLRDTFDRTVSLGWGTANTGNVWIGAGPLDRFGVSGGVGRIVMAAPRTGSSIATALTSSSTDLRASFALDRLPIGGSVFVSLAGRRVGSLEYRAKVRVLLGGVVEVSLVRTTNGAETTIVTAPATGVRIVAGQRLQVRFRVVGTSPTTLQAKVWPAGSSEPTAWNASATDATAGLQTGGGIGVVTYVGSTVANAPIVLSVDDVTAGPG
jgi:hypothetical protein